MADRNENESVRECLRVLGRTANDADFERLTGILSKLRACQMTAPVEMGFKLIVQTWRNTGLTDDRAREVAWTQLAVMVAEGDLQTGDNLILVTEQGRRWLEREAGKRKNTGN